MKKILEDIYVTYYYDENASLLEEHWNNEEREMSDEDFKKSITNFRELVNKYKILNTIVNSIKFGFTIMPELQTWVDNEINGKINHHVSKMAIVMPEDIFEQFSIEQTIEEELAEAKYESVRYFSDIESARNWVHSKKN